MPRRMSEVLFRHGYMHFVNHDGTCVLLFTKLNPCNYFKSYKNKDTKLFGIWMASDFCRALKMYLVSFAFSCFSTTQGLRE